MKKLIMVVEDDNSIRDTLCVVLAEIGFTSHSLATAEEAIEDLKVILPDLVLLDYILNGSKATAEDFMKALKVHRRRIPVVLITACSGAEAVAKRLGVDELVKKPFTLEQMFETVRKYLNGSETQEAS